MIFHDIKSKLGMYGFPMESDDILGLQACIAEAGDGDYLEIGVQQGGSSIFVGTLKRMLGQSGEIYGIDNLQNKHSGLELIEQHASEWGIRIHLTIAKSDPFPGPDVRPVVALIDGDHAFDWVCKDWKNLSPKVQKFILLHDYRTHPGVGRAVREVCMKDPAWIFRTATGNMAVFERCASF